MSETGPKNSGEGANAQTQQWQELAQTSQRQRMDQISQSVTSDKTAAQGEAEATPTVSKIEANAKFLRHIDRLLDSTEQQMEQERAAREGRKQDGTLGQAILAHVDLSDVVGDNGDDLAVDAAGAGDVDNGNVEVVAAEPTEEEKARYFEWLKQAEDWQDEIEEQSLDEYWGNLSDDWWVEYGVPLGNMPDMTEWQQEIGDYLTGIEGLGEAGLDERVDLAAKAMMKELAHDLASELANAPFRFGKRQLPPHYHEKMLDSLTSDMKAWLNKVYGEDDPEGWKVSTIHERMEGNELLAWYEMMAGKGLDVQADDVKVPESLQSKVHVVTAAEEQARIAKAQAEAEEAAVAEQAEAQEQQEGKIKFVPDVFESLRMGIATGEQDRGRLETALEERRAELLAIPSDNPQKTEIEMACTALVAQAAKLDEMLAALRDALVRAERYESTVRAARQNLPGKNPEAELTDYDKWVMFSLARLGQEGVISDTDPLNVQLAKIERQINVTRAYLQQATYDDMTPANAGQYGGAAPLAVSEYEQKLRTLVSARDYLINELGVQQAS